MAVQRPFRLAGSPRGIAQRRRGALVEFGPLEILVLAGEQRFVTGQVRKTGWWLATFFGHPHDPALGREMRREPLDQWSEARIEKQQPVRGVIDYVDDLVVEQPRVDRMADRADARDRVIEFEMAKCVPG